MGSGLEPEAAGLEDEATEVVGAADVVVVVGGGVADEGNEPSCYQRLISN